MFEESVENFILQWRPYAATVQLFGRFEGSPLLECRVGGQIFHLFERTGPYLAAPGNAHVIIHPVTEAVNKVAFEGKRLEVTGISKVKARGMVLESRPGMVVVDVGIPLVVGVFAAIEDEVALGDFLEFESLAPVHGFVVPVQERPVVDPAHVDSI